MVETQQAVGATSVVVTHDMKTAFTVGDRIALLHEGRVVHLGTVSETRDSSDPMVRQFVRGEAVGPLTEGLPHG